MTETQYTYPELEQIMIEKGFTRDEVDKLTDWWADEWDWLASASAEEIHSASEDALN